LTAAAPPAKVGGATVVQAVPQATTFIRGPALALAPLLGRLELHVRHNPLAEVSRFLPAKTRSAMQPYRWASQGAALPWPQNVAVHPLSVPYLAKDGKNRGLGKRLGRRLAARLRRRNDVALLHGHFLHPQGLAAVTAAKRLGLPAVVTGHGFDVYDLPQRDEAWRAVVLETLDGADAVTTVSRRNADLLRALGVPAGKLHVIPNGFDPALFHPAPQAAARQALGLPAEGRLLLSVGNLVPIKGHADLLQAVQGPLSADPALQLALVGAGSEETRLRALASELGIAGQVRFAGRRPHGEIPTWMNAADLFVLPSHAEGCVTVVQEALGCGLPVVATDVGQVPDAIHPKNGLMVEPRRPEAFGKAIDGALRASFDRAAIARAAQETTWATNAAKTVAIYEALAPGVRLPRGRPTDRGL
jgi:teichuronic acid biosynthesis glycosyltransferase TuaC